ncbi:peroxisomal leader peptide-processing protease-like [Myiozetetes cayanensis]|uniref:peroxisomal leader peptide-processing protease-like n=1 Tax=Myiozetetes cayanensis TaxID=478635 RepID=UPI00215E1FF8|nr:peroxisomal leader peptide-processing protease-like [Myiozetetes cayanensis]
MAARAGPAAPPRPLSPAASLRARQRRCLSHGGLGELSSFDVTVVELEESIPGFLPPCLADTFLPGEEVSVVGFGALGRACGPSVTAGILSAVVAVEGQPVMLQTTCAVHGGSSGGPLLSSRSGCLMGIVARNTRDNGAGATYPHLSFCIPITVLQPLVVRYRRTRDPGAFAGLNCAAQGVRAAWKLQQQPGPPSKLRPPHPWGLVLWTEVPGAKVPGVELPWPLFTVGPERLDPAEPVEGGHSGAGDTTQCLCQLLTGPNWGVCIVLVSPRSHKCCELRPWCPVVLSGCGGWWWWS